jgi:hypothetical protein
MVWTMERPQLIPRLSRENKDTDGKERLGTHLTGVLMHGRKNPIRAYTWYDRFPTGSDSVLTIICHALCDEARISRLPPTLFLQLDNYWRENKNRSSYFLWCYEKSPKHKTILHFLVSQTQVCQTQNNTTFSCFTY